MQLMLIDLVAVVWYHPPVLRCMVDDCLAYSKWLTSISTVSRIFAFPLEVKRRHMSLAGGRLVVSHPLTSAREWWCESLCKHAEVEAHGWNDWLVEVLLICQAGGFPVRALYTDCTARIHCLIGWFKDLELSCFTSWTRAFLLLTWETNLRTCNKRLSHGKKTTFYSDAICLAWYVLNL